MANFNGFMTSDARKVLEILGTDKQGAIDNLDKLFKDKSPEAKEVIKEAGGYRAFILALGRLHDFHDLNNDVEAAFHVLVDSEFCPIGGEYARSIADRFTTTWGFRYPSDALPWLSVLINDEGLLKKAMTAKGG